MRRPEPARLGRGLAALLGETGPTDANAVATLPIESLTPGSFQPRQTIDPTSLEELADSIRAHGVLQPLLVRPDPQRSGQYQIIAGERRWRASQAAGLHQVPVLIRALGDADAMAAALVENLQRNDLNAIEEAEGYKRLVNEFGLTQERLGGALGKSRSHVANAMRLLNLPPKIQAYVRTGELSAGHARALLSHADPETAARLVLTRGLNVRQTEALLTHEADPPRRTPVDPNTAAVATELAQALGLKVSLVNKEGRGHLRLEFQSLDQLEGVLALLNPR
jgi:ParB family chromosome partitioning protein